MGGAAEDREKAARLPEGDVIRILYEQHARIHDLFERVGEATGKEREAAFDDLRALLAVHETGEEMVLRPVSCETAGERVVDARNHEEDEATHVLADLEKMDVSSSEFERTFATFKKSVTEHAEHEENEEFPTVLEQRDNEERQKMGKGLAMAEKLAPTHAHPVAAGSTLGQYAFGPFASMVDRARDALKGGS